MIPAPDGLTARYKHTDAPQPYYEYKRVVGFNDEGDALVIDDKGKRFIRADWYSNFAGYLDRNPDDEHDIVSLIPGGGWRATWTLDDGTTHSEPLTGWGVTVAGGVIPLTVDSSAGYCVVDDPTDCKNFAGLQPPACSCGGCAPTDTNHHTEGRTP